MTQSSRDSMNFFAGLWRLADPKISVTSVASMTIGASVAGASGEMSWPWLLTLGVAMFCMEVAKNAWGDVFDYDSGTDLAVRSEDRTHFSGGKRVMVDGLLSRQQTWGIAGGFGALGVVLGVAMVLFRETDLAWIGLLGLALGWSYHGPPLRLVYRGLGELDVVLCYGPIIAVATHLLLTGRYSYDVFLLSLPLGILIAAFLWVNEFPDFDADRESGKYNLVARLGKTLAARLLSALYLAAFVPLLVVPYVTDLPTSIWLAYATVPTAAAASYWTWRNPETFHRDKPVQPMALVTFVLYAAGVAVGVLAGA